MSIALPQLTDSQLTEAGYTAGLIRETRKALALKPFERNQRQRQLSLKYSQLQREVFNVTPEPRFSNDKKAKAPRRDGSAPRWIRAEADKLVAEYLAHVDTANNRYDRNAISAEFNKEFNRTGLGHNIAKLAGWDKLYNVHGYGTANKKGILYEAAVAAAPARFA